MKNLLQLLLVFLCLIINTKGLAQNEKTMYVFGHSLIVHASPTNETTVPHWLHHLAKEANNTIAVSGQYGFLPSHDELPPISQWGFEDVIPAWDSDTENFSDIGFDTFLITPANFVQYKPSNENYDGGANDTSPVQSTLTIVDWINNQEPEAVSYIYENWPDMAGYISYGNTFPPTPQEFENYNTYTQGDFHDWWIDYHNFIQDARPSEHVRLIPVGSVMSKLLTQEPLNQIPILDLYEDDAPHGRPTLYFLASLITYMAIYEQKAPATYSVPNTVHVLLRDNYQSTIDFIWAELLAFNDSSGDSLVFENNVLNTESFDFKDDITIYPNPTRDYINITASVDNYTIELYDVKGTKLRITKNDVNDTINISNLPNGIYFLKLNNARFSTIKRIIKY
ncbi:T9SS type A sorting domain-containing protein [uncultured Algibacter sp.]|uniref:T9SS type A sorting domain-containing protein n=1 Tax=uncultured Algibacter sp. TaxID=298659 RepID=UPI003217E17D